MDIKLFDDFSKRFSAYIPRILNNKDAQKAARLVEEYKVRNVLVGDLGVYVLLRNNKNLNLYLDYSNNIFNDLDLDYYSKAMPIISPELSFNELKKFKNKKFVVLVQGNIVMMNTKYLDLPDKLKDEKRYVFSVRKEHDYFQILNSVELGLFDLVLQLKKVGINKYFLDLDHNVEKKLEIYKKILANQKVEFHTFSYTKGNWDKGVS